MVLLKRRTKKKKKTKSLGKSIEKSTVFSKNHSFLYLQIIVKPECDEHLFSPAIHLKFFFVCVGNPISKLLVVQGLSTINIF